MNINRRDLFKLGSASGLVAAGLLASDITKPSLARELANAGVKEGEMLYRQLGSTGEKVSVIGLGGHHIGRPEDEQFAIKLIRTAIDRGINFIFSGVRPSIH